MGIAVAAACFAFMAAVFFALLSLWGLLAAPFVRMRASSFVIACALALSAAATLLAYRAAYRAAVRAAMRADYRNGTRGGKRRGT
ncbi:MAG: hypothetical protein CVV51_10085 [Spirochaetae bacterium HGW-Spirochaetae-7]|nr:MAG: hypothetical protein CVV51_10085 [Spirochaetae bacterium HGW-Spirochaetae-7]